MATLAIWHGYLLGGTGSNIYSANIAREWLAAGHRVVLISQDPDPRRFEWARSERLELVRPDLGGVLPVYVRDRYEGFEVHRFPELDGDQLAAYVEANRAAMRELLARERVDGVLVNHAVMGPESLRPVLQAAGIPYVVKIHGSEMEYTMAEDARYVPLAESGLAGAASILVGSQHIERRLRELVSAECLGERVQVVPPGVDLDLFAPLPDAADRRRARDELASMLEPAAIGTGWGALQRDMVRQAVGGDDPVRALGRVHGSFQEREPDVEATTDLAALVVDQYRPLLFVGKLIAQKGLQLVIAALPLVVRADSTTQLVVTGFGPLRAVYEAMVEALARGNVEALRELVARGPEIDGGTEGAFAYLEEFFAGLERDGLVDAYWAAARDLDQRVLWTGLLHHEHLSLLWPICDASIVPSIFPEAFGMVAAEAAACGALPVIADQTGLAEVAAPIRAAWPERHRHLLAFDPSAPDPVRQLADALIGIRRLDPADREALASAARSVVEQHWSWTAIAEDVARSALGGRPPVSGSA